MILSLSSSGRVREKSLRYRYSYRITDNKGRDLVLPDTVELNRELTYADSDVLAKTQEEDLLWRGHGERSGAAVDAPSGSGQAGYAHRCGVVRRCSSGASNWWRTLNGN